MLQTTLVHQLRNVKICTKWQKRTKHSLTTVGNLTYVLANWLTQGLLYSLYPNMEGEISYETRILT